MRACWLKWVGRDWSISADYIWLNYSDANTAVIAPGFGADMGLGANLLLASGVASLPHVGLACINPDRVSLS